MATARRKSGAGRSGAVGDFTDFSI
jgi:hypothetical protein